MRVIAGTQKGRQLKAVPGNSTRPTTDKVKEAMFNVIGPYFEGGIGLDLFAGSGSLGIESLSRGLDSMIFVDRHPKAIETIRDNIRTVKLEERAEVYRNDANRALKAVHKRDLQFSVIFLDPPYEKIKLKPLMETISEMELVVEGGWIVTEHPADSDLADLVVDFERLKHEEYNKTTAISIYRRMHSE
ncbi:16S rRNA (guanine(966)-N(2))-methyltransferase RsmD [Bacillus solimangrovi]|uniref:16S rRNA (Guanine(966)-N(2))-methyltransferase RsmD n=1 Tax=Bacillus solimangrovi TaxID=1305675 RepID=A0A1E5LIM3_9BACI|nr:16S rRNA (guanine(966)-N(2))-methyltransferase RsmD [Bacillus solimangrovi]OEH93932.1 16S rRNA (guanine(966)-N(2))-methyltransferase RsmD [Bacillus solimangrovi]